MTKVVNSIINNIKYSLATYNILNQIWLFEAKKELTYLHMASLGGRFAKFGIFRLKFGIIEAYFANYGYHVIHE